MAGRKARTLEMPGAIPSGSSRRMEVRMARKPRRRIVGSRFRRRAREMRTGLEWR